jgi:hypothetical protein
MWVEIKYVFIFKLKLLYYGYYIKRMEGFGCGLGGVEFVGLFLE